jgi:cytochrome d ubiquinol oxidase subunit I
MTDFFALVFNPNIWTQFPHVFSSGLATAAFFVLGISAYHLLRNKPGHDKFRRSFQIGAIIGVLGVIGVIMTGHSQAQHMVQTQPMKMAAAEALWETEDPAAMSLFTIGDEQERRDVFAIRIPRLLSLLAYNQLEGTVQGINDLQTQYAAEYGEGDYVPPVAVSYWSFRIMVGAGMVMLLAAIYALFLTMGEQINRDTRFLKFFPWLIALPYLANTTGWMLTELGRAPWVVYGLMKIEDAVSPNVGVGALWTTLIGFTLLYGALMAADIYLLAKYAKSGSGELLNLGADTETAVSIAGD